jgi:hypothetical protein
MPTFPPGYYPQFENPDLSSLPHPQTPDHQYAYTSGRASFLTLATCDRPTLAKPDTVNRLPLVTLEFSPIRPPVLGVDSGCLR